MLLVIAAVAAGTIGWMRAARRGGNTADRVQYALAHAIPATLAALALQIVLVRTGLLG